MYKAHGKALGLLNHMSLRTSSVFDSHSQAWLSRPQAHSVAVRLKIYHGGIPQYVSANPSLEQTFLLSSSPYIECVDAEYTDILEYLFYNIYIYILHNKELYSISSYED